MSTETKEGFFQPVNLASVQAGFNPDSDAAEIHIVTHKISFEPDANGDAEMVKKFESLRIVADLPALDHLIDAFKDIKQTYLNQKHGGGPIKTMGDA